MLVPAVQAAGYPSVMVLIITAIFVLIPVELGILLWQAKKQTGKFLLRGVIPYCQKLTWWQYVLWITVIFLSSGLIITLMNPVSEWIKGWFNWIPENLRLEMGLSDVFTRSKLIQTYILHFVFIVIVAPLIEELYFRGFLLPRMPESLGWAGSLLHSILFALYHVWSPWMFLARFVALLPLIYIVRWKKNIFLGIGAHWLINSIDLVMGVMFIISVK